jgi:hypothetical protein
MNTNGRARTAEPNVAASFSDLTHDVIELAELQTQLLALDIKKSAGNARLAIALCVVGLCMLLGCLPVLLILLAEVLVDAAGWSRAASFAVAALVGLVASGVTLALGYARIKKGVIALERSRDELNRNITWLKSTLRSHGPAHPRPVASDRFE